MFSPFYFLKKINICNSMYFFFHIFFLFIFVSPAYKHTFISVNNIICNTGCLNKLVKEYCINPDLKYFAFFFLNARKLNFMKKCEKKYI